VLVFYLVMLPSGLLLVDPDRLISLAYWIIWVFGWTAALIVICYRTGPRPRWRWGDKVAPPPGWPRRCQECEYDLTGNTSGVCPECGLDMPAEQIEALRSAAAGRARRPQGT